MSTNYYLIIDECSCCRRHTSIHIGKNSYGWRFSFHGLVKGEPEVRSWQDWKVYILSGRIVNEYDESIPHDEFIEIVESTLGIAQNHFDYCADHFQEWVDRIKDGIDWKDGEGYSFCSSEFS